MREAKEYLDHFAIPPHKGNLLSATIKLFQGLGIIAKDSDSYSEEVCSIEPVECQPQDILSLIIYRHHQNSWVLLSDDKVWLQALGFSM